MRPLIRRAVIGIRFAVLILALALSLETRPLVLAADDGFADVHWRTQSVTELAKPAPTHSAVLATDDVPRPAIFTAWKLIGDTAQISDDPPPLKVARMPVARPVSPFAIVRDAADASPARYHLLPDSRGPPLA